MMMVRDTIAIGTSAGGVEALPRVLGALDRAIPAAILIVQHLSPVHDPYLVEILRRSTSLPVGWAEQGARIDVGRVYVAPPNCHLLVQDHHVRLDGGAKENHSRPSIDRLFRSVAATRGPRAIGVLLTGMLGDGVAGLRDIQSAGGVAIVQDPETAEFPELPSRAVAAFRADHVSSLDAIGPLLGRLAGTDAPSSEIVPPRIALEAELDRSGPTAPATMDELGSRSDVSCPECGGPMWSIAGDQRRYRCFVGHAATAQEMVAIGGERIEAALWSAIRALHDRASTYQAMADDALQQNQTLAHELYRRRAHEAFTQAELGRKFLLDVVGG